MALKVLIAFAMGLPTGWERFKHDRSAGLRTFPLVSMASCAYMLAAAQIPLDVSSQSRILVGVMTGIGVHRRRLHSEEPHVRARGRRQRPVCGIWGQSGCVFPTEITDWRCCSV